MLSGIGQNDATPAEAWPENGTERGVAGKPLEVGNIGSTFQERYDFWERVERNERQGIERGGRVQCRLVIELPHELTGAQEALPSAGLRPPVRGAWTAPLWRHPQTRREQRRPKLSRALYLLRPAFPEAGDRTVGLRGSDYAAEQKPGRPRRNLDQGSAAFLRRSRQPAP